MLYDVQLTLTSSSGFRMIVCMIAVAVARLDNANVARRKNCAAKDVHPGHQV
jgi:hypothetical protein